ncbi:hypothetical protein N657DRAFT_703529 [Parathielavia appendiculata]|uniref:Uncharacterized protein n=1 Tax=Parathielavia appendiculata TaxID=2587402 RepID=A0AAN6U6E5_9PEZI|nr:hypothetical protein N657DRAFT_703529 [Parathielavia appendiculata]
MWPTTWISMDHVPKLASYWSIFCTLRKALISWRPTLPESTTCMEGPWLCMRRSIVFKASLFSRHESYVARCVGALPHKWAPQDLQLVQPLPQKQPLGCLLPSVSQSEADHINTRLARYAYTACRCHFKAHGEGFIVTKLEEVDAQADATWMGRVTKARSELDKLDSPELRLILGDSDYSRIRGLKIDLVPKPVPIESRPQDPDLDPDSHVVRFYTSVARRGLLRGICQSSRTPLILRAHTNAFLLHAGQCTGPNLPQGRGVPRVPFPTPATTPSTTLPPISTTAAGYCLFAEEVGARLRELSFFSTPQSIQAAITKRWGLMSQEKRQRYTARAVKRMQSVNATPVTAAVSLAPRQGQILATPTASTCGTSPPARLPQIQAPPISATWRGNRSRKARPATSTSTPRAAVGALSSSPSPCVMGPVSASLLNSARAPLARWGDPKIKTEAVPPAASGGVSRKVGEVIDLTGDSD